MTYSFSKGLWKGIKSAVVFSFSFLLTALIAKFGGFTPWDLLETYAKPFFSAITVGALLTMLLNYIKVKLA